MLQKGSGKKQKPEKSVTLYCESLGEGNRGNIGLVLLLTFLETFSPEIGAEAIPSCSSREGCVIE